ncbi:heme ABC exporter ATP-binding protein CcmA [Actinomadura sp. HBU206391]|uniref:heme ABC exporter ATP-binding protein CcmA n=1 Tax=Actinomadura sp. HBU206391 TaxID=2731692 RepID=UPI00164F99C5|nr:heme ABC exporter ATP-binding protein CcmA [Actinomadura sp. HBU206391]MBC6462453.1 heme ABC exporter ATP-binding protein CcmA [Actinomadura sp. HBU206391]
MTELIVEARDVGVELGGGPVLRGVELHVGRGDIVAVVGENGAGKSTLLRCLAGLQPGVSGEVGVFDRPPVDEPAFWRDVALVGDEPAWYPGLTVREHLELMPAVHGAARMEVGTSLETFGLAGRGDMSPLSLSTGQRQRLSLAMALIRPSRLLLLDEPERGLDPAFRERLATSLTEYAAEGGTVVMATHDLRLAETTRARTVTLEAA